MKKNLLFILIGFISQTLGAQSPMVNKGNFYSGFDGRQGFYLGFDHKFNTYSIGLDAGTSFGLIYPTQFYSITLNNNLYFGKPNKYETKSWYGNVRITYSQIYQEWSNKPTLVSVNPAIGKQFNLSSRYGIGVDLGVNFMIMNRNASSTLIPIGTYFEFSNSAVPSIRLNLFYRY